jgi:hypothetical protein
MFTFRIYFKKCGNGFQAMCAVDREAPLGIYHGILKGGRVMSKDKALSFAKKHIIYRKSSERIPYEYVIDETNLA